MEPVRAVTVLRGDDQRVYTLLGPHAMDRAVVRELGGPVFTSPGYRWVVAEEDGAVVGWAGANLTKNGIAALDWSYVIPTHRRRGLRTQMVGILINLAVGRTLTGATRQPFLNAWYVRVGFIVTRKNGVWTHYRRDPR